MLRLPDGVRMSSSATRVHGILASDCEERGEDALPRLLGLLRLCSLVVRRCGGRVVGHNLSFDIRAVDASLDRLGSSERLGAVLARPRTTVDTMRLSLPYSPLKNRAGRTKAFRLDELYVHLFGRSACEWASLHDAMDDVRVTVACYEEGVRRGWWD